MKRQLLIILTIIFSLTANANNKPSILLTNGTIHVGNGKDVIQKGSLGIRNGRIEEILTDNLPSKLQYDTIIDCQQQHIYPSLIALNSTLGLQEIESLKETLDFKETGWFNPNVRAIVAYFADSQVIPTVKRNGIHLVQITPQNGLLSGLSSVVQLEGNSYEEASVKIDEGLHVNWNALNKSNQQDLLHQLKQWLVDAKNFHLSKQPSNLRLQALNDVIVNHKRIYIHVDHQADIIESIAFFKELGLSNIVIVGGYEAYKVKDLLLKNEIPIVLSRLHTLPKNEDDDIYLPYKLPSILQQAGILVALDYKGDMDAMGTRNLPFTAGTAAAYGLTKEQALACITINAAKILGIDKDYGSLEVGKVANLIVSKGDILNMSSNEITWHIIGGKITDATSKQELLYKKYKQN